MFGSPGECSTIDLFLKDAFGLLSRKFWSTVLQCGARLPIHTLIKLLDRTVHGLKNNTRLTKFCDLMKKKSV